MLSTPEHIIEYSGMSSHAAHSSEHYIEFYGWLTPDGSSADALGSVTATDIFGSESNIPATILHDSIHTGFTADSGFQIITTGLFLLYFLLIFRFGGELIQYPRLLAGMGSKRDRRAENDNPALEVSIGVTICGLVAFSLALFKILSLWNGDFESLIMSHIHPWLLISVTAAVIFVTILFQKLLLLLAGSLTFNNKFAVTLYNLRRAFLISVTIITTPVILLLSLTEGIWADIFAWTIIVIISLSSIAYIVKSFLLFVGQKVSILFWILYLCVIELMPFAVIATGIMKNTMHYS